MSQPMIFICYSHQDKKFKTRLEKHLKVLNKYCSIICWSDSDIKAGEKWREVINTALNQSNIAILLVSIDFLNSDFIRDVEIPKLQERAHLYPLMVSDCHYQSVPWLECLQFFNDPSRPLNKMKRANIDEIMANLSRELESKYSSSSATNPPATGPLPPVSPKTTLLTKCPPDPIKLIGRKRELRKLETLLSENKAVVLVNGMGGIGKTEVCRTFFHNYHGRFAYAGWVDYHSSLKESFFSAIYEDILGENRGEDMEERFKLIIRFLQSQPGQVFLVVDNIDNERDPDLLELTALRSPVLVNSRQRLEGFQSYSLDVLDMKGCKELFYRYYEIERNEDMVEGLIGRCGNHTLTVELLARVGQQAGIKLEELLVNLGQAGLSLGDVGEEGVRTFWHSQAGEKKLLEHLRVVFDLSQIGEEEMGILLNLSILPAIYIDQENIKKWLGLKSGGVIERLVKRGWLRRRGGEIFMHQVVQEVVRSKEQPTMAKCRNLVEALGKLLYSEPGENPLSKKVWLVYGEVVLGHLVEEEESLATLANNLSLSYQDMGDLSMALSFQEQAVAIYEKTLGKDHPDLATSYHNLSTIYLELKNYQQALFFSRQAVNIVQNLFPNGHPNLDKMQRNLEKIEKKAAAAGEKV